MLSEIKSDKIAYNLTYVWNIKKTNKRRKTHKLTYGEETGGCQRWSEGWEWRRVKWLKGVKRYKFPVV